MKRIVFGVVWFLVLFFGILFVGSAVVGGIAGSRTQGQQQGAIVGERAGRAFGEKYGTMILLGSLLIAVAGSATGVLPGTRTRED
jgi:hypothetical protein